MRVSRVGRNLGRLFVLLAPVAAGSRATHAQSAQYRTFTFDGVWTPAPGVVQFNFVHRFYVSPAPARKVSNFPTFTLAAPLGRSGAIGTHYGSNSLLVPGRPNEFELFARWRPIGSERGPGPSVALVAAYNTAARSVDAELTAAYTRGRVTVSGVGRFLGSAPAPVGRDAALGAGAVIRLNDYVALAGDAATLLGTDTTVAWSAGLNLLIPGSPHSFSLHASNVLTNTVQSASVGFSEVVYGFEFTIPLRPSRFAPWFGGGGRSRAAADTAAAAAEVAIRDFRYARDTVRIGRGQVVRWRNDDQVAHTVTFGPGGPGDSGLLAFGASFAVAFSRPGIYHYHCDPHPRMRGVVVVRD